LRVFLVFVVVLTTLFITEETLAKPKTLPIAFEVPQGCKFRSGGGAGNWHCAFQGPGGVNRRILIDIRDEELSTEDAARIATMTGPQIRAFLKQGILEIEETRDSRSRQNDYELFSSGFLSPNATAGGFLICFRKRDRTILTGPTERIDRDNLHCWNLDRSTTTLQQLLFSYLEHTPGREGPSRSYKRDADKVLRSVVRVR